MNELKRLRKDREQLTQNMAAREQEMATLRPLAASGDESAEVSLVVKERQHERDRGELERMDRRTATLEIEEQREGDIRRLLEEARQADEALTRLDIMLVEESGRLDASLRKLLAARADLYQHGGAFFSLAKQLAHGIYSDDLDKRAGAEALRAELEERGAALRAIGAFSVPGLSNVFEHAGESYQPPILDDVGQWLAKAVENFEIAEVRRAKITQMDQERATDRAETTEEATV